MNNEYMGFEVGPIRPPSEHASLLLRVTRNCSWNHCRFCGLYKGEKFSIRPVEHVLKDIDTIKKCVDTLKLIETDPDNRQMHERELIQKLHKSDRMAYHIAREWYRGGMTSVFLQDANTMIIKPDDMINILHYLRNLFPTIERITSYGRSHTIARISDDDLKRMSEAGLNRIHVGMESGSDKVLTLVQKGVDKATQIVAGQKVKRVGIQLSEYYMPGLGGNEYSSENAIETADAINQINPDFIRIRTLAVPEHTLLFDDYQNGIFTRTNDTQIVEELLMFIEHLDGITSTVVSDHILNLIPEFEGKMPDDKIKMIEALKWYLKLTHNEKMIYRVGRRTGHIVNKEDFYRESNRNMVEVIMIENHITEDNIDRIIDQLMNRFI